MYASARNLNIALLKYIIIINIYARSKFEYVWKKINK